MPGHQPKHDDFVDKLVGDAKAAPNALLLSGFVGKAAEDGHTRLYLDPELREYVDIPNDDLLYSKAIPEDASPLGGSFVWINRDAELIHGSSTVSQFKARFLEGRIATAYGAAAAAMQAATPNQFEPLYISHPVHCIITAIPRCVTLPYCPGHEAEAIHYTRFPRKVHHTGLCFLTLPHTHCECPPPPPRTGYITCGCSPTGVCGT
jgi:hypothetical protein